MREMSHIELRDVLKEILGLRDFVAMGCTLEDLQAAVSRTLTSLEHGRLPCKTMTRSASS